MKVCTFDHTRPVLGGYFVPVGEVHRRMTAMITSHEYQQFAHECTKWAIGAPTDQDRKSFLELACDWTFAAMVVARVEKQETRTDIGRLN
jgi:hypothetical protein